MNLYQFLRKITNHLFKSMEKRSLVIYSIQFSMSKVSWIWNLFLKLIKECMKK